MLLAFDTATPYVSVALYGGDDSGGEGSHEDEGSQEDEGGQEGVDGVVAEVVSDRAMRHGEQLAPLIERVLTETGTDRGDLTAIGVGVGPGPFTGLRVGLVTARTLGLVLRIPVYGVCSLDVLAVEAVDTGTVTGNFVVATDARRKEVYVASYDGLGRRLAGPEVLLPAVAATDLPVVGEGAVLYPESFPRRAGPLRPSAGWLARVVTGDRAEIRDPEPLYLRRPDVTTPGPAKSALGR